MQNAKNSLFLYLTPRQKSQLLGTLKSYAKKFGLGSEDLAYKFLEDEKYYLDINNPHFEFVGDYLEDDIFLKDLKKFFDYCQWEKRQKELMEPYLDKQKELAKIARKKAQEFKMSKLKPTKKQLVYYEKIIKAHGIEKKDTENASRLDLRNWIMEIIEGEDN
ncbi:MAG: hypothetical protein IJW73_02955 [Candidatus Gastranaerophilales bacterium]|nr:hypothetical protein [Candidatus Gastranaerophilales bacterium]